MAGKKNIIGIKFGVDPESAGLIKSQLEDIASKIQIDVNVNESHFSAQLKKLKSQLQKELGDISINLTTRTATQGKRGGSSGANDAERANKAYERANAALQKQYSLRQQLKKVMPGTAEHTNIIKNIQSQNQKFREQLKIIQTLAGADDKRISALRNYKKMLIDSAKGGSLASQSYADETAIEKLALRAQNLSSTKGFDDIIKRSSDARTMVESLQAKIENTLYNADGSVKKNITAETVKKLSTEVIAAERKLVQFGQKTDTIGNKIRKAFDAHFVQQIASWLLVAVTRALRQVYQNVVELDKAVTDLQIATGGTRAEAQGLVVTYAQLAKQLGATTLEVTSAADTWLRQGYSISETNKLITYTLMLSKLGQIDSAEAAKALTSAMRGYKVEVQDALKVVDKLTAVDMEAAVSAGGIATAMAETAAGAEIAGVSMDRLIGYIATVAEVTQDAEESVGTYFRTLFSRMGRVAEGADIDDEGEDISAVETVLSSLGIRLRESAGEFRNFGDVLDEVGGKWDTFNEAQQRQLAGAFAGMRQQEKFIVLMENYGDALDYMNTASSSEGTAQEKFDEAYLNSVEAKINALTAAWQEFSATALNSEAIKGVVTVLTALVNALNFLLSHLNTGILLVPIITTLLGKLGIKGVSSIGKLIKSLKSINANLEEAKRKAQEASKALNDFVNTKGGGKTVDQLNEIYDASKENNDQLGFIQKQTGLSKKDAQEFIDLKIQETRATEAAQAAQLQHAKTLQTAMYGAIGILTTILSITSSIEGDAGSIITLVVAGIALVGTLVVAFLKKTRNAVLQLSAAEKTSIILTLISVILTIITAIISALSALIKTDAELKEEAKENAKAAQEEADAMREIADAAKEASDSIKELIDEIKEASDTMNNAQWVDYIDQLGQGINKVLGDEELTSLQAINKLLGTAYTYQDLMNMSAERRLELLDEINAAQLEATQKEQEAAYQAQKSASKSTTDASGMRERIKTKGSYVVDEFEDIYEGLDSNTKGNVTLSNTGGKNFKLKIETGDADDFVKTVKSMTGAYEEKYKYNLAALQDNEIYQYLTGLLSEGEEALKLQMSSLYDYLSTTASVEGLKIPINLDAEDVNAEYDRVVGQLVENLRNNNTISVAMTEGLINEEDLLEYATRFISKNYAEFFNKVNPQTTIVALKKLENMLKEVEGQFDVLSDAMEDMSERGILSADTIKTLKEEFPELMEYVQETAEGFVLMDGALSSYLNGISAGYMDAVRQAQEYFDTVYAAYEASSEKTIEQYQIVIEAQNSLNNAIKNAENWRVTEATLTKDGLVEQYTELLEEQQDALDEQCDKYKELCDIRKDLLETYQEELDYQRELADKQKNVADLQTQLAMAKLDNSAAGKAKQRELQAQLDEANEELNEYTLEHAIEDITKDIEEAESAYEDFIQAKIDEISSKIESIVSMSTQEISSAITALGERPIVLDTGDGSTTSTSGGYNDVINSGKESAGQTISDATVAPPEETEPVFLTSGKLSSGVSIGGGLSGLSNNARHNDDVDVTIGGSTYDLLAGSVADSKIVHELNSLNGGSASAGDIVAYDGALYIYDKKGDWRKMADDHSSASSAAAKYLQLLNEQETHHTGGFAGNVTDLKSNEVFAKLLKGELVSTPEQMDNFIKTILPSIVMRASQGDTFEYNAPLFEIHCGNIDKDTLPDLETIINKAVEKFERRMGSALSRTGHKKNFNK